MGQQETPDLATVVLRPCTAAGCFHSVCLHLSADVMRRKKPSATPGSGPAQCGCAAQHDHTALTSPRPQQKGLLRSESAAKEGDKVGNKQTPESPKWKLHVKMCQRKKTKNKGVQILLTSL